MPVDSWKYISKQRPAIVSSGQPFSMTYNFTGYFNNTRYLNVKGPATFALTDQDGNLIKLPSKTSVTAKSNYVWDLSIRYDFLQPEVIFNSPVPQYTGTLPINLVLVMTWTEQYLWSNPADGSLKWIDEEVSTAFILYWEPNFFIFPLEIIRTGGLTKFIPHNSPIDISIDWHRPVAIPNAKKKIDYIDFWDVGGDAPIRVWQVDSAMDAVSITSKIRLDSIRDVLAEFSETQSTYYLDIYAGFEHSGYIDGACPYNSEFLCNLFYNPVHPNGGPAYKRTGQTDLIRWKVILVPANPVILSYTIPSGRFPADEKFSMVFNISNTGFYGKCYLEAVCGSKVTRLKTWETEAGAAASFSGQKTMLDLANNPDGVTTVTINVGYFEVPDDTSSKKIQTHSMSFNVDVISKAIAKIDVKNSSFPPVSADIDEELTFDISIKNEGMAGNLWISFEGKAEGLGKVDFGDSVQWLFGPATIADLVSPPPAGGQTVSFKIRCGHYEGATLVQDDIITRSIYVIEPLAQLSVTITNVIGEIFVDGEYVASGILSGYDLDPGEHTVSFGEVEGYVTPADITFNILSGQTRIINVRYAEAEEEPPASGPVEKVKPNWKPMAAAGVIGAGIILAGKGLIGGENA